MITGKRIFITGGAGYLGKNLIRRYYGSNEITCFSRDEAKHYFLRKLYPKIRCIVGDIRDLDHLIRSAKNHDTGIFAASLKQIAVCDENPMQAVNTILLGAIYSRLAAEENRFEAACFISSDKACASTTIYGACKFAAEQSFIVNASPVRLSSCRYGNVMNSTGSVIPLIHDAIKNNYSLQLYSEKMTRFMISIEEAIDLIEISLSTSGLTAIPKLKSFRIKDLFDIYKRRFGLRYTLSKPRIGEKIHESMICAEEIPRIEEKKTHYLLHPELIAKVQTFPHEEYSSRDFCISKKNLETYLEKHHFYL